MTARYFYCDPLAAAWMQEHFGMRFVSRDSGKEFEKSLLVFNAGSPVESIRKGQVYVVHPESLPLLEPKLGDLVFAGRPDNDLGEILEFGPFVHKEAQAHLRVVEIIQRDGKAFHWPESVPA